MARVAERVARGPEAQRQPDRLTDEELDISARGLSKALAHWTKGHNLTVDETRALGAKDSAHGVFFLHAGGAQSDGGDTVFAVKRFRRVDGAERELHGIEVVRARGFQTLTPVGQGIYPIDGVGSMLVTEHVPRFTTMNYLGWRDSYAGQPDYERRLARPLRGMARYAAQLHSAGVIHTDLQVKNVGQDGLGRYVAFDLEGVQLSEPENIDDLTFVSQAGDDLSVLLNSLVLRGFLWSSTEATFSEEVHGNLLDPYMESTQIRNPMLLEYMDVALQEAVTARAALHSDFSSRMGLPS